jgi:hypothetical protein
MRENGALSFYILHIAIRLYTMIIMIFPVTYGYLKIMFLFVLPFFQYIYTLLSVVEIRFNFSEIFMNFKIIKSLKVIPLYQ